MLSPTTTRTLPRGVPVLVRPDGRFLVGSTPRSAVVQSSPPAPPVEERPPSDEADAWAAYDRAGSPDRLTGRGRASVAVVGSARTADVLLEVLAAAGVGRLVCDRPEAVPARVRRTGNPADSGPADVAVLLDEHTARPVAADGLLADGVVHLSVVVRDTDALIGPLVLPGRSACLRCVDRWRTDADPCWPATRDGLSHGPRRPVDAATAHTVAGLAALQVLSHLDGVPATTVGASLELLLPEGRVRARGWAPHPDCGCVDLPL
jgi:bacteriocin biosynthesis cyclodehydratase domain-containing protein